jgi:CheY-like chemotaxis protein
VVESAAIKLADEASPELPAGHGEPILVVDDESAVREITKNTLEEYGYKVLTASDRTEAIALFAQHKEEIRVVLTDVMMPYMDGPAVIRAIRKLNPEANIIVSSGLKANGKAIEAANSGGYDLIILGATGATDAKLKMLGSVSAKVAWQASCSVAVVKYVE